MEGHVGHIMHRSYCKNDSLYNKCEGWECQLKFKKNENEKEEGSAVPVKQMEKDKCKGLDCRICQTSKG